MNNTFSSPDTGNQYKFDYDRFFADANHAFLIHEADLRYGQFLSNQLAAKYPDISNQLPESLDPYYDNKIIPEFLNYLATLSDEI